MTEPATPARRDTLPEPAFAADLIDEQRLSATDAAGVVSALRDAMERVGSVLDDRFRGGGDIQQLVEARAWAVDRLLHFAWDTLMDQAGDMALLAVGGFGRGHLRNKHCNKSIKNFRLVFDKITLLSNS